MYADSATLQRQAGGVHPDGVGIAVARLQHDVVLRAEVEVAAAEFYLYKRLAFRNGLWGGQCLVAVAACVVGLNGGRVAVIG